MIDDNDKKENYLAIIYITCIYGFGFGFGDDIDDFTLEPTELKRHSEIYWDDKLIFLFKEYFKPYIFQIYDINIDGWIYYNTNDNNFHDEILILSNEPLVIKGKKTLSPTLYKLPTREQFLKKIEHTKIKNNSGIKPNTILSNVIRISP